MDWKYECVPINLETGEILTDFDGSRFEISVDEVKTFLDTINTDYVLNGDAAPIVGIIINPLVTSNPKL